MVDPGPVVEGSGMFVIAHVSDIHIDGTERATGRTTRVMEYLRGFADRLDVILITGDLADHGAEPEYEVVRQLATAPVPVLLCPGNHDARPPYRKALLDEEPDGTPVNRAHRVGGVTFLMADSSIPGDDAGLLDDATLAWLDAELAAGEGPAFVCFHHPPVPLHMPMLDEIRMLGADRLAALVRRHPRVVALLCGHAHTPAATTFAGLPLLVAPGVASTVKLPWEPGPVLDREFPPAIAFHVLEDGRLTTHFRLVA
jgi:3',5'-cyclic AMP phosphodiesterase CpdA